MDLKEAFEASERHTKVLMLLAMVAGLHPEHEEQANKFIAEIEPGKDAKIEEAVKWMETIRKK